MTPISPTFYKDYSDKFLNDNFVGTGKYILKRFSNEIQIIDPNLNYWGDKPNNEGISFIGYSNSSSLFGALKSKQIDVLLSNSIDDSQRNNLNSLSKNKEIKEGNTVKRTKKIASINVGEGIVGRVVNTLGIPFDGKGTLEGETYEMPLERKAPGVIFRHPVNEPLQTGIKSIDAMIPIGRGQRELVIGDRQTGKTTVCIDTILNQKEFFDSGEPV